MPPSDSAPAADATTLELLTIIQARVLGCLVEKESTTPDGYPMTANAVVLACNQKTSRDPVVELEPGAVGHTLRELEDRRLVASVHGARAQRYEHRFARAYSVTRPQQALLAMLLLRGAQTLAELLTRCERMAAFDDVVQVRDALDRLAQRSPALAVNLGRVTGQREDRYMHLLCGPVAAQDHLGKDHAPPSSNSRAALEARVDALEDAMQTLRDEFAQLRVSGSPTD
ncbi:MAG: YceH family protein [Luteimonas sp.]